MKHFEIAANIREQQGTSASRRLRNAGKVPGVIYGAGEAPQAIELEHTKLLRQLGNEAFASSILTLDLAGRKVQAVLKSLQRHPFKPKVLHADFLRVSAKEKITMKVPLHFKGGEVAPGVKLHGGIVSHLLNDIEIRCLPADLPEFIEVDLAHLDLDEAVHLSDLVLPQSVELYHPVEKGHDNDLPVAAIHVPRAASETDAAGSTPETVVIGSEADSKGK